MELRHVSPSSSSQPESYAQKVFDYSRLDARSTYLSGTHYARLGKFLTLPYLSFGNDCTVDVLRQEFEFVTFCELTRKRDDPDRTRQFSKPEDFQRFLHRYSRSQSASLDTPNLVGTNTGSASLTPATATAPSQSEHSGFLVFLQGFPSARWLNTLGSCLEIDPEFLFRHMDVPIGPTFNVPRPHRIYSTPFPQSRDLIRLRVCNSGSWNVSEHGATLNTLRKRAEDSMCVHLTKLSGLRDHDIGESIIRRFILHDLYNFSIEQYISVEVIYHTRKWCIVVWLDSGKELRHSSFGPFSSGSVPVNTIDLHPIFQHRSRMALSPRPRRLNSVLSSSRVDEQQYFQSIDHLRQNYGSHLRTEIMAADAFYALNELFEFSAASVDQLLEILDNSIRASTQSSWLSGSSKLSEALIIKALVDDYRSYVGDTLEVVTTRGGPKWPRVVNPKQFQRAERAASLLQSRYETLLKRCERLSEYCNGSIAILHNAETQRQTERAIEQTNRLSKLTLLAYIYIPITFASGFFGMNFRELGAHLSIWVYFATAIPLSVISIVAWSIDFRRVLDTVPDKLNYATNRSI